MLQDQFNRIHTYLRISLIDFCNFRCTYCMPQEKMQFLPHPRLMQQEEILQLAQTFVGLGVNKIRLTGGEPLARKDFNLIVHQIAQLPVLLTLTTNGFLLDKHFSELQNAGIQSINISLDTLQKQKFTQITQRDGFDKVWSNIQQALNLGFRIKLNVVLMQGVNDDELNDFIALTKDLPLHVRFIEFMPFDKNQWKADKVVNHQEVIDQLNAHLPLIKLQDKPHDTDRKFRILGYEGTISFISTLSHPFCSDCNRLRLTADGKLKNCLFGAEEFDLLTPLRMGKPVHTIIEKALQKKHQALGGQFTDYKKLDANQIENRSMIQIGG